MSEKALMPRFSSSTSMSFSFPMASRASVEPALREVMLSDRPLKSTFSRSFVMLSILSSARLLRWYRDCMRMQRKPVAQRVTTRMITAQTAVTFM